MQLPYGSGYQQQREPTEIVRVIGSFSFNFPNLKPFFTIPLPRVSATVIVLLPENLRTYFELSAQAWILYKAPQWNARYPKPKHGFDDYHNKDKS